MCLVRLELAASLTFFTPATARSESGNDRPVLHRHGALRPVRKAQTEAQMTVLADSPLPHLVLGTIFFLFNRPLSVELPCHPIGLLLSVFPLC